MVGDPVGDFLARIRNAGALRRAEVTMPYSRLRAAIAEALVAEGYLTAAEKRGKKVKQTLVVELAYREDGTHAITGARRLSTPGRRLYISADKIVPVKFGRGALVLSTPRGILTGAAARRACVGGEQLFTIW